MPVLPEMRFLGNYGHGFVLGRAVSTNLEKFDRGRGKTCAELFRIGTIASYHNTVLHEYGAEAL